MKAREQERYRGAIVAGVCAGYKQIRREARREAKMVGKGEGGREGGREGSREGWGRWRGERGGKMGGNFTKKNHFFCFLLNLGLRYVKSSALAQGSNAKKRIK